MGLRRLVGALAGIEAELLAATENWVELLVAELVHLYPNLKPQVRGRASARSQSPE